ncbi:MAG TPA: hypothetical protein VGR91_09090 [Stellaceae bacterium]|nr:hypothetical protein [Stellaceae bacterium]
MTAVLVDADASVEIDEPVGSHLWPRTRPKRNSERSRREAALADAAEAELAERTQAPSWPQWAAAARERAAVARIIQLHGELKAREVELGRTKAALAEATDEAEALRARLEATQASLSAANREAAEKDAAARAGIFMLRRELAARGAALVYATKRVCEMASRMTSAEIDVIEAAAANAVLAGGRPNAG